MNDLKIAASNIGWSQADDEKVLSRMRDLGFSGLEIAPTRIFSDNPYANIEPFALYSGMIADTYELAICSMQSIWRGRSENIFISGEADTLLDLTSSVCDFARAGKVPNIVFGCPKNRNIPAEKSAADAIPFLKRCGQLASHAGSMFALEANPEIYGTNFLNNTKDVFNLLNDMDADCGLSLNFDVGTIIENNEQLDILKEALPYISHIHISEPNLSIIRPRQIHREMKAILKDYEYEGYISLEMRTAPFSKVEPILEYMSRTFLDG